MQITKSENTSSENTAFLKYRQRAWRKIISSITTFRICCVVIIYGIVGYHVISHWHIMFSLIKLSLFNHCVIAGVSQLIIFEVSIDHLLTCISFYNKKTSKELGLTETSIDGYTGIYTRTAYEEWAGNRKWIKETIQLWLKIFWRQTKP